MSAQPLGKHDLSFRYWPRVLLVAVVLAAVVVTVAQRPTMAPSATEPFSPGWPWVAALLVAGFAALGLAVEAVSGADDGVRKPLWLTTKGHRPWSAAARWILLVAAALAAGHFGAAAQLPEGQPHILRVELAGSSAVAGGLGFDPEQVRRAITADWWFLPSYVLLVGLLALWAGSYYRLAWMRQARVAMGLSVLVAGLLDAVENLLLLRGIDHVNDSQWDAAWAMAATAAWAKLLLLVVVLLYSLGGVHAWMFTPRWVRQASWQLPDPVQRQAPMQPAERRNLGIALSGGGIRAASISLGALQVLERSEHDAKDSLGWAAASAVTAVSGGSNMASGWAISRSTYAGPEGHAADRVPPASLDPQPWAMTDDGRATPEELHLMENLGYLLSNSPRGVDWDPASPQKPGARARSVAKSSASYRPPAYATVFAGFAINSLVLLAFLYVVTRPIGWGLRALWTRDLSGSEFHTLIVEHHLATPGVLFLALGLLFLVGWVLMGQFLLRGPLPAVRHAVLTGARLSAYSALAVGVALLVLLTLLPALAGWVDEFTSRGSSALTTLVGAAGVAASVFRILRKPAARFAPALGGVLFAILLVFVIALWVGGGAATAPTWDPLAWNSYWVWLVALSLLVVGPLVASPEYWSMAAFYRGKLRLAYATYRPADGHEPVEVYPNDNAVDAAVDREPGLAAYVRPEDATGDQVGTPLVVCATSTISSRAVRTHYGIPALSVTFDPAHVTLNLPHDDRGRWQEYRTPTRLIDALATPQHKRLTTMMAVALSSAAVSPAMGAFRIGPTSMLLTFANIRLGVWMPNPRYAQWLDHDVSDPGVTLAYPRTGLGYLFKEFFGIHDISDPFLYMTDGGHWENTGLVEMLRRGDVSEIVCVDADSGPGDAAASIGKAMDLAPLECGVRVHLDLDPLRARLAGTRAPDYATRTVNVGFFSQGEAGFRAGDSVGVLWYAKPGLTSDMPDALLAFRETHPDYPRVSTLDQFFDTSTFVAYRDLGRYNARVIVEARQRLLEALDDALAATDHGGPLTDEDVCSRLDAAVAVDGCHWVVRQLGNAVGALGDDQPMAFLTAVRASLQGRPALAAVS